jgi:hypothetical protein
MDRSAKSQLGGAEHFSRAETELLESGLVRLEEWSPQMLVPFQCRQLRRAMVLWINRRWFLERQFDLTNNGTVRRIHEWLVDEFAYAIPQPGDPQTAFTTKTKFLHADRYGSSTGRTPHGGSGRVATIGAFQAKGIGVTPLVGHGGDPGHSHGCCSIEEAIREAIYSEVAAAEFPHGAVPVVAILTTELIFANPGPTRRAIVIRPAVLRIAHAERAPMFKESLTGFRNSQIEDSIRTRDVVQKWIRESKIGLPDLLTRVAEQVAFGQVHRLFSGGYFSSNLAVDGSIMDHGGMRALPNWVNARNLDGVAGFGEEMMIVNKMIESLAFYFNKYRPKHSALAPSGAALRSCAQEANERAFARECLRIWGFNTNASPALTSAVVQPLRRYFSAQQKYQVNYKYGENNRFHWLHDETAQEAESKTLNTVSAALCRYFAEFPDGNERCQRAWITADRYLMPRKALYRENLKTCIEQLLSAHDQHDELPERVGELIRTVVASSRRHWPTLPPDLAVLAQVSYEGSSALLCDEFPRRRRVYWLEGLCVRDKWVFFDSDLPINRSNAIDARSADGYWTAQVPATTLGSLGWLKLPKMLVSYASHPVFSRLSRCE